MDVDTLEIDGKKWEVVFATSSPKCGRILLLKCGEDEWAIATDNRDGTSDNAIDRLCL